jgi:hypothetical protein
MTAPDRSELTMRRRNKWSRNARTVQHRDRRVDREYRAPWATMNRWMLPGRNAARSADPSAVTNARNAVQVRRAVATVFGLSPR